MIQRHRICFLSRFPPTVISCKIIFQYQNHIPCIVTVKVKNNQVTTRSLYQSHYFFKLFHLFILIFGCAESLLLCIGFPQLQRVEASLHCSAGASHWGGFSHCRHRPQAHGLQQFRYACYWLQLAGQNQGLNSCSPALEGRFLPTESPGKSRTILQAPLFTS